MDNSFLESTYTVRFNDCDPFRHLNNARYLDYFLNAREDHLLDHYQMDLAEFYRKGQGWVVLQHEILYFRPASFNEMICIRSGLIAADSDHLQVEMLMTDEARSQLKAILHSRFVPVSLTSGRKEPHSPEFLSFISSKLIPLPGKDTPSLRERAAYWQQVLSPRKETAQ
jgi:acyl-CoA thioester hydrolase